MNIAKNLEKIKQSLPGEVTLVAVSKTYPAETVLEAYRAGQRVFGENKVQELVPKYQQLPKDIEWHLIGHLQSNKVKYIAPFVHLIHSVDSLKLLTEIDKQAGRAGRIIDVLLQIHIATEETKFGFSPEEAESILRSEDLRQMKQIRICGLMGMASLTDDETQIRKEFSSLKTLFDRMSRSTSGNISFTILSMGMSSDYRIAIECGSNMIRIGSSIFGSRNYSG